MITRLSQFLESVNVTAPSGAQDIMSKVINFANDAAYESALGAGTEGSLYYNTTYTRLRLYRGGSWTNQTSYGIQNDASNGSDISLTPTQEIVRLTGLVGSDTLAGIDSVNVKELILVNDTAFSLSVLNDSTNEGTAAKRILTGSGSNLSFAAGSSLFLVYDSTETRWRIVGGSGAGLADPMTNRGDIIIRNPANTTARLPVGAAGQYVGTDGVDVWWENFDQINYIGNPDALHNATDFVDSSVTGGGPGVLRKQLLRPNCLKPP